MDGSASAARSRARVGRRRRLGPRRETAAELAINAASPAVRERRGGPGWEPASQSCRLLSERRRPLARSRRLREVAVHLISALLSFH